MKPYIHAKISAKRWGGIPEDYLKIHDFIDSSKECLGDVRHRALLHSTFGCYIAEKMFGHNIINSDNKEVSVRDIAKKHIIEDLGILPTVEQWLSTMPILPWMSGFIKKTPKSKNDEDYDIQLID